MLAEKVPSEKAVDINLVDLVVDNKEELMNVAMEKVKFLFPKNQTVLNAIKLCANHLADKDYMTAYQIEKQASSWYQYDDKESFLNKFRNRFLD